jgi:hypothetical protein
MTDIPEKTREQLHRVVNDIIFMAHRIRVPSKRVKDIFVDQILKLDELKEYFDVQDSPDDEMEDKGD